MTIRSGALVLLLVTGCARERAVEASAALPAPPVNRAPVLASTDMQEETEMEYDNEGAFTGMKSTLTLVVNASDPDGDPLRYEWGASAGELTGDGNRAVWTGNKTGDRATVRILDGKGGVHEHVFEVGKTETITVYTP
jgi:hypothetical protein